MQAAGGKRLLSSLASKLHPQLPLSPRESQQLLTLLTTSFRAHLDREHPLTLPSAAKGAPSPTPSASNGSSSYASATQHIDSILTNPLFAVRRPSESDAVNALEDPLSWFVNEVARGAATLPKAALCLDLLERLPGSSPAPSRNHSPVSPQKDVARVVFDWLETSGLTTSKSFINYCGSKRRYEQTFLERLLKASLASGQTHSAPWSWLLRPIEKRVEETGLDLRTVIRFRQQLLGGLISVQAASDLDKGVATFVNMWNMDENNKFYSPVRPESAHFGFAGAHLVRQITSNPDHGISPGVYTSFLQSCSQWPGVWSPAVESMLWLHHPTEPSALPGLRFIQSPLGAVLHVQSRRSRRRFLVQLCLGVARQLMEQERYVDAQIAMRFSKEHFADMVLFDSPAASQQTTTTREARKRERQERKNLELLDGLALS